MGRPINTKSKRRSSNSNNIKTRKPAASATEKGVAKTEHIEEIVKDTTITANRKTYSKPVIVSEGRLVPNIVGMRSNNLCIQTNDKVPRQSDFDGEVITVVSAEPRRKSRTGSPMYTGRTRKNDRPYSKANKTKSRDKKHLTNKGANVIVHGKYIISLIKSSVDTDIYRYTLVENFGRANMGTAMVTCNLALKEDPKNSCTIAIILSKDLPTQLVSVSVIDITNNLAPVYLFSCLCNDPRHKMDKYIPSIIGSTQDKIK